MSQGNDTTNLVMVDDGEVIWGADRNALFAAMEALGWERDGNRWFAPDTEQPYADLCNAVHAAPGYGYHDCITDTGDFPVLRYVESEDEWRFSE